jgi:hypothetical protein
VVRFSDAIEAFRIALALPSVEIWRRRRGPRLCAEHFRAHGKRSALRSAEQRHRLKNLIHAIDRLLPDGGNCYRRVLLELALDPTAAAEPVVFGLKQGGGSGSGHAWLGDARGSENYDAEFRL